LLSGATASDRPPRFLGSLCRGPDCRIPFPGFLTQSFTLHASRLLAPCRPRLGFQVNQRKFIHRYVLLDFHAACGTILGMFAETTCPVCSRPFTPKRFGGGVTVTCSRACAARHFRDKGDQATCHCGRMFYRRRSQAKQGYGTTCSRACHFALRSKKVACTCASCGTGFMSPHYQVNVMGGGKFCSRRCLYTFRRKLRKRGEQEMFTNWQKREWKDASCARCYSAERLELDHIVPRFAGGTATRDNAQTLCRTCNRKKFWTDDFPLWERLLKLRAEEC
jgi:hypothetical protein